MQRSFRILIVVVGIAMAAATTIAQVKNNSGRIKDALPAGTDLSAAQLVEIRDDAGQMVLSGKFSKYKADLASKEAGSKAKGLAEIEIEKKGSVLKQEIEATVENLQPQRGYTLLVDGHQVSTFTTDKAGKRAMKYTRKDSSS